MNDQKQIPHKCPSCSGTMAVTRLQCTSCSTIVTGTYDLCSVCKLDPKTRELFDLFIKARGNLKEVERLLGVSYPTARLRIDEMFQIFGQKPHYPDPKEVLCQLRNKEITVDEAEELLRG